MRGITKKATGISRARLVTQAAALALLSIPFLRLQSVCAPVLYCHSCPLSAMACPIGVAVNFSTFQVFPFITIGILGLVGTIGGRFVCGWLCPFGLIQDLLHRIRARRIALPRGLIYAKYAVLVGLVLMAPLLLPGKPYTFCDFCPAGTLESAIPWAVMGVNTGDWLGLSLRIAILSGVLLLAVAASRGWCRVLCPLGAMFSAFNKFSLLRLKATGHKCTNCGACREICSVGIDPIAETNSGECIRCLDCTSTGHVGISIG